MIEFIAIMVVTGLILQDFLLGFFLVFNFYGFEGKTPDPWPKVSVLIPSRNEEHNLPRCLYSLNKLDYPLDKLEIILGDDRSSDRTWDILEDWQRKKDYVHVMKISEGNPQRMNGKANALAQMAEKGRGELLLFTDADCVLPPSWIKSMVRAQLESKAGVVTGITAVAPRGLFARMQGMDWWLTLGMVKVISDWGNAVTSMGNNMLITKEAYDAVGGFAGIPFSLTEDFEIGKAIKNKGYRSIHLVSKENLAQTEAMASYGELLRQRKRWMHGAMQLPNFWKLLLLLQVAFFPAILFLVFLHPFEGLALWLFKVATQGFFIYLFASKTAEKLKKRDFVAFELYYLATAWSTIVYYFWPSKTDWKGRQYG